MTTFEDWYKDYPRKEAKLAAMRAWEKVTRQFDASEIHEGLKNQLDFLCSRDRKYIPLPATWLNAGRWMDELEAPVVGDRTKLPFERWGTKDKQAAGNFLRRVGAAAFLKNGYTQEHLDGLQAERQFGLRVVA